MEIDRRGRELQRYTQIDPVVSSAPAREQALEDLEPIEEGAEQTKLEHRYVLWVTQVNKKFNAAPSDRGSHNSWTDELKPIAKFETVRMAPK